MQSVKDSMAIFLCSFHVKMRVLRLSFSSRCHRIKKCMYIQYIHSLISIAYFPASWNGKFMDGKNPAGKCVRGKFRRGKGSIFEPKLGICEYFDFWELRFFHLCFPGKIKTSGNVESHFISKQDDTRYMYFIIYMDTTSTV